MADRVSAKHGNKQYGVVTILIQLFFEVEKIVDVAPENFRPAPKVWSTVIRLKRKPAEDFGVGYEEIRKVVKLAFLQRRKVMNNAIKAMLGNYEGGNEWLDKVLRLRAEALSVEDFIELTKVLKVLNNG